MDEMKPGEAIAATGLGLTILGIIVRGFWSVINLFSQVKKNTEAIEQIRQDSDKQFALVREDIKEVSEKAEKRDEAIFDKLDKITDWIVEGRD